MENKQNNLEIIRHSFSHVLAAAIKNLYPDVKFAIGPAIDNGFYYDFDFGKEGPKEEDLKAIEKKMKHIIKQNLEFKNQDLGIKDAIKKAETEKQPYKLELIKDLEKTGEKEVSYYSVCNFEDLCKGPHVEATNKLNKDAFKLDRIAGAYWRGDEKNKMLTRIYGFAFETKEELDEYLKNLEEARKRDHKKLGKELDLFSFHADCPGMAHWHEKGMVIWNELEKFGKNIRKKYGSIEIKTPQMAKNNLWITSGHWDHYKEDMFVFDVDEETYCLKPMDCPFNINIYKTRTRSYKDLPIRYTEIGRVFRNEKSGQLNGLFRVREISQDDSHIFCTEKQVEDEIVNLLNMVDEFYTALNIKPKFYLSTRPEDFMGEIKTWDKAENDLKKALKSKCLEYDLKEKDGAFYGPKIDVDIEDALGRSWQVATIQLDFQLPGRFDCKYIGSDGKEKVPVMIHAAIFGSFERMIGILTEHHTGAFPTWLAPVQVKIISVGEAHVEYCQKLADELKEENIRIELDINNETVSNRIRKATSEKVPFILVIGDKEMEGKNLSVRRRGSRDTEEISKENLIKEIVNTKPGI